MQIEVVYIDDQPLAAIISTALEISPALRYISAAARGSFTSWAQSALFFRIAIRSIALSLVRYSFILKNLQKIFVSTLRRCQFYIKREIYMIVFKID